MPQMGALERLSCFLFDHHPFADICVHGEWKSTARVSKIDLRELVPCECTDSEKKVFLENLYKMICFSKTGEELPFADRAFIEVFKCHVAEIIEIDFNILCGVVGIHYSFEINFADLMQPTSLDSHRFEYFRFNISPSLHTLPRGEMVDTFYNLRQHQFEQRFL